MRVAVIGLGNIGEVHIKVIQDTKSDLVAVCDIDIEKCKNYSGVKYYTDYLTLLDEVKPDVAHICTPHYLHAEMILAGLQRDINVLCEKPLCIKREEIPLILEAEKNSKAQLGVCFQTRYNSATVFAKEYLSGKKILSAHGELKWCRDKSYYAKADWRGKWATEGGGVLINQALHTIDLLQYFCGMPESVIGVCENRSLQGIIEVEDTANLTIRGKNNITMYATNADEKDYPVEIVFKTDSETVRLRSQGIYINEEFFAHENIGPMYGKQVYGSGHNGLIRDFYDCITTGRKFLIDGTEGLKAVRIVLAAYESGGKEIKCK